MGTAVDIEQSVYDLLAGSNRVPFLFVGSGMSRRYMGTEDWAGLLGSVCDSIGRPMHPFYYYLQRALRESNKKNVAYPLAATQMEDDFLTAIDEQDRFKPWIERNRSLLDSGTPAMKVYVSELLKKAKPTDHLDELELLHSAEHHIAGVITTNYDYLMESVLPKYNVYYRESDLLFSELSTWGDIYKIHGSMDDPDSMVLDSEDYNGFAERSNFLLAKIFTVFGEYPVIFLGYSINDEDIRGILSSIALCAGNEKSEEMARRFVFINYSERGNQSVDTLNYSLGGSRSMLMTQVTTNDFSPIYRAIGRTHQLYTPRLLSQLSKQIFIANDTDDDAERVVFVDMKDLKELPPDKKIVLGLASGEYGKFIPAEDVYEDVLFSNKNINASLLINDCLEKLLKDNSNRIPMYMYLQQYPGVVANKWVQQQIRYRRGGGYLSFLSDTDKKRYRSANRKHLKTQNIEGLIEAFGKDKAYKHLPCLNEDEIDVNDLKRYLAKIAETQIMEQGKIDSDLRKCILIYDFLKYGREYMKNEEA